MAILDNFQTKSSNLRPLLSITFPQGFRISKNIGHPTSGSAGKKTFKRYLKSEHMDRRTDGQTHGQTDGQTDGYLDLLKASAQRADALKIGQTGGASRGRVCYQRRLPSLVFHVS